MSADTLSRLARAARPRRTWPLHALLICVSLAMAIPFLWMLITALKSKGEIAAYPPDLLPHHWKWSNYGDLLDYVRQSNNPEIVRDFEERFVRLLPTIEEQTSIQLLNGLEEALVAKRQPVEADERES